MTVLRSWRYVGGLAAVLFLAAAASDRAGAGLPSGPAGPGAPSADLRPGFAARGVTVRSQGSRGTCSVFTMTGAIEYALGARRRLDAPLSVEFLNWASNEATADKEDGGFFSDLWTGFEKHGLCPESAMPYEATFDPARRPDREALRQAKALTGSGLRLHWIKPWDVNTGVSEAQLAEIKRVIAAGWPVCGGFRWPKKAAWTEGVLQMAPPEGVFDGHSVLLVGYRDGAATPGGGVFLLRNSGKGGPDGSMTYQYALAYMNDAAWVEGR